MAGTTFDIDVDVSAAGVEPTAAAVASLAKQLAAADTAAVKAAEAVKAGEASYKQTEAAADRAAKALEKINVQMQTASGSRLQNLVARQAEAAKKAHEATAAMNAEAASLDKLKTAAVKASEAHGKISKAHDQTKKAVEALKKAQEAAKPSGDMSAAGNAMKKLGGPMGQVADLAEGLVFDMKDLAGSIGVAGAAAAGAVLVFAALAAALIGGVVALGVWAVKTADAARSSRLLSDGIAQSVEGGGELEDSIRELSKRVPQTRDELRNMAADLAKTGLKGDELTKALEKSAEEAARLKWGPDFKKQTLSLNKLATRFGDNLSDLFGRLDIGQLLEGLGKLVDLFDAGSVTGKAMRVVFESLFQPLIDGATNLIPKIIAGFIQMQIWILKALIMIKPYGSEILIVVKALGLLAAVVVGAVVVALAIGVGIAVAFWTIMITLGKAVMWVSEQIVGFGKTIIDYLSGLSLSDIGTNLVMGLVNGIMGAGPAVLGALGGIVGGAIDSAKKLLGIASPSKVFTEIGMQTAAGMAGGVEGGAGGVQSSLESMVAPPDAAPATASVGAGGGNTYQITINAPSGDAKEIGAVVEDILQRLLDGDATQIEGAVAV